MQLATALPSQPSTPLPPAAAGRSPTHPPRCARQACESLPLPLPPCCSLPPPRSELARLGKEKLLFAARDRLHGVRGRTALLTPSVQIEPLLLPGAMALLHQVREGGSRGQSGQQRMGAAACSPRALRLVLPAAASPAPLPPRTPSQTLASAPAASRPKRSCGGTTWCSSSARRAPRWARAACAAAAATRSSTLSRTWPWRPRWRR